MVEDKGMKDRKFKIKMDQGEEKSKCTDES